MSDVTKEQAIEAARSVIPEYERNENDDRQDEPECIMARYLLQPAPPSDVTWAREFVARVYMAGHSACMDEIGIEAETADIVSLAAELAAMSRPGAVSDDVLTVLEELVNNQIPCDENMHPAWCCNHQSKRCNMDEIVARARAILAAGQPLPAPPNPRTGG